MCVCCRCRGIHRSLLIGRVLTRCVAIGIIQRAKQGLSGRFCGFVGTPCQRRTIIRTDRCPIPKPKLMIVPAPVCVKRFIEKRCVDLRGWDQVGDGVGQIQLSLTYRCFIAAAFDNTLCS